MKLNKMQKYIYLRWLLARYKEIKQKHLASEDRFLQFIEKVKKEW